MEFRLVKSVFRARDQEKDKDPLLDDTQLMTPTERFHAGWYLSYRAHGLDPYVHHRMGVTVFSTRKRPS